MIALESDLELMLNVSFFFFFQILSSELLLPRFFHLLHFLLESVSDLSFWITQICLFIILFNFVILKAKKQFACQTSNVQGKQDSYLKSILFLILKIATIPRMHAVMIYSFAVDFLAFFLFPHFSFLL